MSDAFLILAMQSANHTGLVPYLVPNGRGNTWLEVSTDAASVTYLVFHPDAVHGADKHISR